MRVKIVFALLLVLFVGYGGLAASRDRPAHNAPPPPAHSASAAPSASAPALSASAPAASGSAPVADAGPVKLFDRPLRVVSLGWDLAAPALLANGGLEPAPSSDFTAAGLDVHVGPVDAMGAVEGALARGGADKDGADIAVIPFSSLVASYEQLRALAPEAFFVVGFSRGREALVSTKDVLPAPSIDPRATVSMVGVAGEPATFLGLFALDQNGVPPSAVRLIAPAAARADDPALGAIDRGQTRDTGARRNILLTTADASRLVPFVAVAQRGLVEKHGKALSAFARVWLEASKKLGDDPPTAARRIASVSGAPEPIALLKRLGDIAPASLSDNARLVGLSGRGALSLDVLFQETWRLYRAAGMLATPAPDLAPISGGVIASLVRQSPSLVAPSRQVKGTSAAADAQKPLITFRQAEGKGDEAALITQTALFADLFERSALRVAVIKGGGIDAAATKKLIEAVEQRFDVAPGRVTAARKVIPRASGSLEVLAAP